MLRFFITLLSLFFMLIVLILRIDNIILHKKQFNFDKFDKPLKADNKQNSIN